MVGCLWNFKYPDGILEGTSFSAPVKITAEHIMRRNKSNHQQYNMVIF
jgi:hypothetical protein